MTNKSNTNDQVYKSFEQWKAEIFPKLSEEEARKSDKADIKKTGISLANSSFDNLLKRL